MPFLDRAKMLLDRKGLRPFLAPLVSQIARWQKNEVQKIFYDDGVWMHDTSTGYFAYPHPYVRLNMKHLDAFTRSAFFWGFQPRPGDVILDVGAGVGEETLTFSRAVGERGRVVCIEAHPRTFHCLQNLIQYNCLRNAIAIHRAVSAPGCTVTTIENSHEYLRNRLIDGSGISVPGTTVDAILKELGVDEIHFLKMNIEGAERFAIRGMVETLRCAHVLCVSCHDFLADAGGDNALRTKAGVSEFLQKCGLRVLQRPEPGQPPYLRDQVWGYNEQLRRRAAS